MKHQATTILLSEDVWEWVKMQAIKEKKPMVEIIRQALKLYRQKKEDN